MKLNKKAFTLAEVMITLTVIGIITAVILPVAMHSKPDENVMKFKKAHNTLYQVISTLVNSDKYYLDGDLGLKPNGSNIKGGFSMTTVCNSSTVSTADEDLKYFCNTFADVVSTKSVNCSNVKTAENDANVTFVVPTENSTQKWETNISDSKKRYDTACKNVASTVGAEITTSDNVIYYQANPAATFGINWLVTGNACGRLFHHENDVNNFTYSYKIMCLDVDGINKGEDPFGYGIRTDGHIMTGARADQWLEKNLQGDN